MIKLPREFLFSKIISMISRVYLVPIQRFISPCLPSGTEGSETNEIDFFKTALKLLIEEIKKNTKDKYEKFKTFVERPVLIKNTIITLNKLFLEKSSGVSEDIDLIAEDELFLAIIIYVAEILWANAYLFVFSGLSEIDKIKRKLKISILIGKTIQEAIEDTFMQLYITESYNDRINALKKVLITNKNKTVKYSEEKIINLIDEIGGQGLFMKPTQYNHPSVPVEKKKIKEDEKENKNKKVYEVETKPIEKPKEKKVTFDLNSINEDPFERRKKMA